MTVTLCLAGVESHTKKYHVNLFCMGDCLYVASLVTSSIEINVVPKLGRDKWYTRANLST